MKLFIYILLFLISIAKIFPQKKYYYPPLEGEEYLRRQNTQEQYKTVIVQADTFHIFNDDFGLDIPNSSIQDGTWLLLFNDQIDSIYQKVTYKNGLKHGPQITYDQKGRIKEIENYENGKLEGKMYRYDLPWDFGETKKWNKSKSAGQASDSLKMTCEFNYHLDKRIGEQKRFYFNGQLQKLENIMEDSVITTFYYKNGQKESEEFAKIKQMENEAIRVKTGIHRFWTKEGKLLNELLYENGALIENYK